MRLVNALASHQKCVSRVGVPCVFYLEHIMNFGIFDAVKDIGRFLLPASVLGVDIGTASVKVVQLSRKRGRPVLENYGILGTRSYLEHQNQAIQTSSLKAVEKDVVALLKILLKEMRIKQGKAVVAVPSFVAFITPLEIPLLSPQETKKAISFQARQYIPLPPSEVTIDWFTVGKFQHPRGPLYQRALLMGIPNDFVRGYQAIFRKAGLTLATVELESLAVVRALGPFSAPTMIIDFGAESTNVMVAEGERLVSNGQTDYGGSYLTQALSRSLGVSMNRAEDLKRRRGLKGEGGELELSTLMLSFLDVILQECEHAKKTYEERHGKKVERLVLVGGGANLIGIEQYFGGQLGLAVTAPAGLTKTAYDPKLEAIAPLLNRELSVALGLALRQILS